MANLHQTFAPLLTGTRDLTAGKGDIYHLSGDDSSDPGTSNNRLDVSLGATLQLGNDTQIVIDGNTGYKHFLQGRIEATRLTYIFDPTVRGEFIYYDEHAGVEEGGYFVTTDLTLVFLGGTMNMCHLENPLNEFNGFTRFIIDMTGGNAYIYFGGKEFPNMGLDIATTNLANIILYSAYYVSGYASLPNFSVKGLTDLDEITFKHGQQDGFTKIYDPVYHGLTDNFLTLKTASLDVARRSFEFFTLDVTDISETAKIRVSSGDVVQHEKLLSVANCEITTNTGTNLSYYTDQGKRVVDCLVRTFDLNGGTRNNISFNIREAGFVEFRMDNFAMNNPIVLEELEVDIAFQNTLSNITIINNVDELYDIIEYLKVDDMTLPIDLFVASGKQRIIKDGYTLLRDQTLTGSPVQIIGTDIKVKTGTGGMLATENATSLVGVVGDTFIGNTDLNFIESSGLVTFTFSGIDGENFGHGLSAVLYKLSTDTVFIKQIVTTDIALVEVLPSTSYDFKFLSSGYTSKELTLTSGEFGSSFNVDLIPITNKDGVNLYSKPIVQEHYDSVTFDLPTHSLFMTNETTTDQIVVDLETAFRIVQDITHAPNLIDQFPAPVYYNKFKNSLVAPLGNYTKLLKSANTPKVHLNFIFERDDGSSLEVGGIKKTDGTDLVINGDIQYHFNDGITVSTITTNNIVYEDDLDEIIKGVWDYETRELTSDSTILQEDFNILMDNVTETIKDKYKGGSGDGITITQEDFNILMDNVTETIKDKYKLDDSVVLTKIEDNKILINGIPINPLLTDDTRITDLVNGLITTSDIWSNDTRELTNNEMTITQEDFNILMDNVLQTIKDKYKADVSGTEVVRNLIIGLNE